MGLNLLLNSFLNQQNIIYLILIIVVVIIVFFIFSIKSNQNSGVKSKSLNSASFFVDLKKARKGRKVAVAIENISEQTIKNVKCFYYRGGETFEVEKSYDNIDDSRDKYVPTDNKIKAGKSKYYFDIPQNTKVKVLFIGYLSQNNQSISKEKIINTRYEHKVSER